MLFFLLGLDLVLSSLSFRLCLVVHWLVVHWFVLDFMLNFMLDFVFNFMLSGLNNCLVFDWLDWGRFCLCGFLLGWFCFSRLVFRCFLDWFDFWLVDNWLVFYWFVLDCLVLNWFMLNRLVLNWLMLHFLMLNSWLYLNWLMLGSLMLSRLMFLLLSNGLERWCLMLKDLLVLCSLHFRFHFMLDLRSFFCRLHFFLIFSFLLSLFRFLLLSLSRFSGILLIRLFELLGDISNCRPIFRMLLLLPSHLDVEASGEYFLIKGVPNEIDGINFGLEDDFKGSRVVFFDLDKFEIREGLFNIFLYRVEVAFDEIERYVLDLVREIFNLLD